MPTLKTRSAVSTFAHGNKTVTAKNRTITTTSHTEDISTTTSTTSTTSAAAGPRSSSSSTGTTNAAGTSTATTSSISRGTTSATFGAASDKNTSDSSVSLFFTGDLILEERIDELIEFNMVYGHSDVSEELMGPIFKSLGQWCDRIRWANKAGLISKGNIQLLQKIGFHWGRESSSSCTAVPVPTPEVVKEEPVLLVALGSNRDTLEPAAPAPITNPLLPRARCPPIKRTANIVVNPPRPTKRERIVGNGINPSSQYCDPRYPSSPHSQQSNQLYQQGYYYSSRYYIPWHSSQHQYKQPYNSYYQPPNPVAAMQANTSYNCMTSSILPSAPSDTSGNSSYSFHHNRQAPPQQNIQNGITLPMTLPTALVPTSKQESQSEGKADLRTPLQIVRHLIYASRRDALPPNNPAAAVLMQQSFNKRTIVNATRSNTETPPPPYVYGDEIQHLVGKKIIDLIPRNTQIQVSVYTRLVISQLQILRTDDKPGRKCLYIGFPGLKCRHCDVRTHKRSGAYFPTSVKTLSDSKKTLFAVDEHLQNKCLHCPQELKDEISRVKANHEFERRAKFKYGGQRAFFFEIWKILHPDQKMAQETILQIADDKGSR